VGMRLRASRVSMGKGKVIMQSRIGGAGGGVGGFGGADAS